LERNRIDLSYLEQFTGGDAAVRNEMLELLRSETETGVQDINRSLAEVQPERLERSLHHMKSTVAYLGNPNLSQTLERAYRAVLQGDSYQELVQDFLDQLEPIKKELDEIQ
jgi:HPt (histidine-containing phosphotransfer) domain-containing protein